VTGATRALAGDFVGAYLQGSFALGSADEHSDVDFVVVTAREPDDARIDRLQAMHEAIFELPVSWAQHLEGSYVPAESLRRLDPGQKYPFLDNGSSELVGDEHCNTAVVRWILRERGIGLAGPPPRDLVDPVSAEQLRSEALTRVHEYAQWARESADAAAMNRWQQSYLVLTFCRLLHTARTGTVTTKANAAAWALESLTAEWAELIRTAVDDRPDPWGRVHEAADPQVAGRTLAFASYAVACSIS